MKAIILAAGYGNRMRPLTDNEHKTLLKINNLTIIDNIIQSLISNNILNVVIVTGYRHDSLKSHITKSYPKIEFEFIYNKDYRTTNNIYSLSLAFQKTRIDSDIILIESDLVYNHKIIQDLINDSNKNIALVDKYRPGMDGTVVKIGKDNRILEVIPPHLQDSNFSFHDKFKTLNIYKFSQDFTKNIFSNLVSYYSKAIDKNCYYELVLGILIYMQRENIYSLQVNNNDWIEVDDTNDIRIAEYKFASNNKKEILKNAWGGYWNYNLIDFCFIRNMYFPTPSMIADLKNNIEELIWNYGSSNELFNKKLSYYLLKEKSKLCALNGAAQIYPFIKKQFSHLKGLIPTPTFGEYENIFIQKSTYRDNGSIDIGDFTKKISASEVIIYVNPNNPTGTFINSQLIHKHIKSYPEKFFIIDESFIDFSNSKSITEIVSDKETNFLVIKSMSKSHGFPGIRLGYVFSNNIELISKIKSSLPIWNYNSMAEYFLEIMLKYRNEFENSINKTIQDREKFIRELQKQKWVNKVFESKADFILVETSEGVNNIVDLLLDKHSIYIRNITSKFNDNKTYYRFAVRKERENQLLINTINTYFD